MSEESGYPYRTTVENVRAVMDTDLDDDDLLFSIRIANAMTDAVIGTAITDETILEAIETFLAAHFAVHKDPQVRSEKLGSGSVQYVWPKVGQGLLSSQYGQSAMDMDYSGKLKNLGKSPAYIKAVPEGSTYA